MNRRNTSITSQEIGVLKGSRELFAILTVATVVGGVTHDPVDAAIVAQAFADLLKNAPGNQSATGRTNLD